MFLASLVSLDNSCFLFLLICAYDFLCPFIPLCLIHTFCVWLHLFSHNDIHACPIAECYTSPVYKLVTFCVLGFLDGITWILSYNYTFKYNYLNSSGDDCLMSAPVSGVLPWSI